MNITRHQQNYDVLLYKTDFPSSFLSFFLTLLMNAGSVGWTERKANEKKKRGGEERKKKKKRRRKKEEEEEEGWGGVLILTHKRKGSEFSKRFGGLKVSRGAVMSLAARACSLEATHSHSCPGLRFSVVSLV